MLETFYHIRYFSSGFVLRNKELTVKPKSITRWQKHKVKKLACDSLGINNLHLGNIANRNSLVECSNLQDYVELLIQFRQLFCHLKCMFSS